MTAQPGTGATDEAAFEALAAQHQRALLAHCYRMTGSLADAEDALQETLVRAWRAWDSFEGRSSRRTWLFRVATNASLRLLEQRRRRVLPVDFGPPHDPHGSRGGAVEEDLWLTPFPGAPPVSPDARYESKETVRLAFVAALQHLPPRQRAALLLRDVLGFSAAETAETLATTVASANSALNRARRALEQHPPAPDAAEDPGTGVLVDRLVDAWVRNDVAGLVALLSEDVEMTMPPMPHWYRGLDDVTAFLRRAPMAGHLSWHARDVDLNGQPGFALYSRPGSGDFEAHSLNLLTVRAGRVDGIHAFLTPSLFSSFGLPAVLPGD